MLDNKRILIVEDEESIRSFVKINLLRNKCNVLEADRGEVALDIIKKNQLDLIILDIMLPGIDGFEVCRLIREMNEDISIIMLTAKTQDMDKIMGFEFGADDYLVKPFNPLELIARIKAIFKRVDKNEKKSHVIEKGIFKLDSDTKTFYKNNEPIELTYREFSVMNVFMKNENRVLTRDELLNLAWGEDFFCDIKTVDVHVRRIREKIEDVPSKPKYIKTVWGYGYTFKG
ncbi:response regulator transcription factor [Clostridium brassicae]|uniref:Stage 0 sporulation protein A homolog n=1 Tax=Clostridium brassicae TaxID=2999072 RepID=A0ABT4DEA1_9CLOT|nr:response regulator transcription factor [Clostridium brassicae]MCY6960643.1 response regulator transcription factor [Clostridium brassicae]